MILLTIPWTSQSSPIVEFWNRDEHGSPRDGGLSGVSPEVVRIDRILRMTIGPNAGDSIAVILGHIGRPEVAGSGFAAVVITGDVIDESGNKIGDLRQIAADAMTA